MSPTDLQARSGDTADSPDRPDDPDEVTDGWPGGSPGESRLVPFGRSSRPFLLATAGVSAALVGIHVVLRLLEATALAIPPDVLRMVDVHRERNVPSFWNAVLLVMLACAAWAVASLGQPGAGEPAGGRLGWNVAGVVALLMAADETLVLHEHLFLPLGVLAAEWGFETGSYRWVLPGAVFAALAALVVVRWSLRLPRDVRRRLLVALGVYAAGALGAEAVSGVIDRTRGIGRTYHLVTAVEEGLEMLGVVLAVGAVLAMLQWLPVGTRRALVVRTRDDLG